MSVTEYDGASRETREGTPPLNRKYIPCTMKVDRPVTKLLRNLEARNQIDSLRILLIEGDKGRADQLLCLLDAAGHCAILVPDLDEAAEALSIQRFDLVLLASGQSVEGSAGFVSKLRNLEAGQRSNSRATVLGYSPSLSGAPFLDGSLPDEFNAELLADAVIHVQTAGLPASPPEPGLPTLPVFEPDQFGEQCANETGLMIEILDLFSDEQSRELPAMFQALGAAEFEQLSRLAHTLKGSLAALHAPLAWHRTQSLEMAAKDGNSRLCTEALQALNRDLAELNTHLSSFRQACLYP